MHVNQESAGIIQHLAKIFVSLLRLLFVWKLFKLQDTTAHEEVRLTSQLPT